MRLERLSKIPVIKGLLYKLFRNLLELYMAKEKLIEKEKQVDMLTELLAKEFEEKKAWKNQVDKIKVEERQKTFNLVLWITKETVGNTFKFIREEYYLVPKSPPSLPIGLAARKLLERPLPPKEG